MLFVELLRLYDLVINQVIAILFYTYLKPCLFLNFLHLTFLILIKFVIVAHSVFVFLFELGYF